MAANTSNRCLIRIIMIIVGSASFCSAQEDKKLTERFMAILSPRDEFNSDLTERFMNVLTPAPRQEFASGREVDSKSHGTGETKEPCSSLEKGYSYRNCMNDYEKLRKTVLGVSCKTCNNQFSESWLSSRRAIAYELGKIRQPERLLVQVDNIMKAAQHNQRINTNLVKSASVALLESRLDLVKKVNLDHQKIFPQLYKFAHENEQSAVTSRRDAVGEWDTLNQYSPVAEPESKLNYFREDDDLHQIHETWHATNENRTPTNRHWERFASFHRILLFRYFTERYVEGLENTIELDRRRRNQVFSTEYKVSSRLSGQFASSSSPEIKIIDGVARCRLSNSEQSTLNQLEDDLNRGLENSGSLERYSRLLEVGYHNRGHGIIGRCVNAMQFTAASARIPVFYRWHYEVDLKYEEYLNSMSPLTYEDLLPPSGVTIEESYVTSRCDKNQLETFWNGRPTNISGHQYKLDHIPFKIHIKLRNEQRHFKKVIIRIFLGLDEFWKTTKWYFEMDRFVVHLAGIRSQTIIRDALDSSSTFIPIYNKCGLPQHLYLPKGKFRQPVKYRLLVFVNDVDQNVNEGEDRVLKNMMCGFLKGVGGVSDSREFGFPLVRRWEGDMKERILSNMDRQFGNVSTVIQIAHAGLQTHSCNKGIFTKTSRKCQGVEKFGMCYWVAAKSVTNFEAVRACRKENANILEYGSAQHLTKEYLLLGDENTMFHTNHRSIGQRGPTCIVVRKSVLSDKATIAEVYCHDQRQMGRFHLAALCQRRL